MSKTWWAIGAIFLVAGGALAVVGFARFEGRSLSENLIAEGFGILVGIGLIVWLVEGRAITRQRRVRETLAYRRDISQEVWNFTHMLAREMAQAIARDFDPPTDLDDHERPHWQEFKPLLRRVFRLAIDVPEQGLPARPGLGDGDARHYMESALVGVGRIQKNVDSLPHFNSRDVLGSLSFDLEQIVDHVRDALDRDLVSDPAQRYAELGHLGELVLQLEESLDMLPNHTEAW